ncbi:MAG: VOC family protein [Roseovarius sp.]|nr:VOC family protein [Roseovarius sp.]
MKLELDHIAIAAATLAQGKAMVEAALGVRLQPGGQHAHFGTHNMLLGLEDGLYLEVIAIDPDAPALEYPRWFDLDRFHGSPKLTNWICRTDDLAGAVRALPGAGRPVALTRGDLRWQMAVPETGILPYDNAFPALIEWQSSPHPATRLDATGCRLHRLVISHPEAEAMQANLSGMLSDARVRYDTGPTGFRAEFDTPNGRRVLE